MKTDVSWSAAEVRWQDDALCNGAQINFIPDKEEPGELALVRGTYCDLCPVRTVCLRYAITYGQRGYWGGTDTAERRRLRSKRDRAKCPVCSSRQVVRMEDAHDALCLACGLSWLTGSAAVPRYSSRAQDAA